MAAKSVAARTAQYGQRQAARAAPRPSRSCGSGCRRLWGKSSQAMRSPTVIKRINDIKSIPVGNTAEEFRSIIRSDFEIFGRVIANAK